MHSNLMIRKKDLFFYFSFLLFITWNILSNSFFSSISLFESQLIMRIVIYGNILLLFINETLFSKSLSNKIFIYFVFAGFVFLFMNLPANSYRIKLIALTPLFMFCARDMKKKELLNVVYYSFLSLLIIVIVSSKLGIIQDYLEFSGRGIRHYLGFLYSLYGPCLLLSVSYCTLMLTEWNKSIFRLLFLFVLNIYLYTQTLSRLSFLLTSLTIFVCLISIVDIKAFKNNFLNTLMCFSHIVGSFVSIILSVLYTPKAPFFSKLNTLLTGRLHYGHKAIESFGISLLPRKIEFVGNGLNAFGLKTIGEYNYVDCLYLQVLLRYGLIFFIIFILFLVYIGCCAHKNKSYNFLLTFSICALQYMIDDLSIALYFNPILLFSAIEIFEFINFRKNKMFK